MSDTLKIGLSLKDDFNSLRKREDVHPDRGNWIELGLCGTIRHS